MYTIQTEGRKLETIFVKGNIVRIDGDITECAELLAWNYEEQPSHGNVHYVKLIELKSNVEHSKFYEDDTCPYFTHSVEIKGNKGNSLVKKYIALGYKAESFINRASIVGSSDRKVFTTVYKNITRH